MTYFDHCDYQDMSRDSTNYFSKKKVVNFGIIHHECRGDPLNGSYKDYKTVKGYSKGDKEKTLGGFFRNIKRDDLLVKKDVLNKYFKKN